MYIHLEDLDRVAGLGAGPEDALHHLLREVRVCLARRKGPARPKSTPRNSTHSKSTVWPSDGRSCHIAEDGRRPCDGARRCQAFSFCTSTQ